MNRVPLHTRWGERANAIAATSHTARDLLGVWRPSSDARGCLDGSGTTNMDPASTITVAEIDEFLDRGERVTFVDARNAIAWAASRVKLPGAIRVPVDEVDRHIGEIQRDGHVVPYCT